MTEFQCPRSLSAIASLTTAVSEWARAIVNPYITIRNPDVIFSMTPLLSEGMGDGFEVRYIPARGNRHPKLVISATEQFLEKELDVIIKLVKKAAMDAIPKSFPIDTRENTVTTKEDVIALANEYLNVTPDGKVTSTWRIIDSNLRIEEGDNAMCDVLAVVDLTNHEVTLKFEPPVDGDWTEIEGLLIGELDRAVGEAYTFSLLMKADANGESVTRH